MDKFKKASSLVYNAKYFHKLADSVEKLNDKEYHLLLGPNKKPLPFYALPNRKVQVLSNLQIAKVERNAIVNAFQSTGFIRGNKWDKYTTIGFMEEMIRLKTGKDWPKDFDEDKYISDISIRYCIPKHKLRSTMSLIITNIKRGYDQYNLLEYFDWFELFEYKYKNNEDQLFNDFKSGKLNNIEEEIYRELYNI